VVIVRAEARTYLRGNGKSNGKGKSNSNDKRRSVRVGTRFLVG
jgi:hypothetical protein